MNIPVKPCVRMQTIVGTKNSQDLCIFSSILVTLQQVGRDLVIDEIYCQLSCITVFNFILDIYMSGASLDMLVFKQRYCVDRSTATILRCIKLKRLAQISPYCIRLLIYKCFVVVP